MAIPLIIDEAEAGTIESKRRMAQIMELARQSSSNTASRALRGTADGNAISFLLNSLFIMGSIQPSLNNAADNSRFTVIEFTRGEPGKFREISKQFDSISHLKNKLLAFTIQNAQLIRDNQIIIKQELLAYNSKIDARQADQLSWQISGYWALKFQSEIDTFKLSYIFTCLQIDNSEYIEANKTDDEGDCLGAMLNIITPERNSLYRCIKLELNEELRPFGIRIIKKYSDNEFEVFFSAKNYHLRKSLENTEFHDYAKMLRRLPEIKQEHKTVRIAGVSTKGLVIKLNLFDETDNKLNKNSLDKSNKNGQQINKTNLVDGHEVPF